MQPGRSRTTEHGQVAVLTAVLLVGLVAFVGLGIDVARLASERTSMQRAADAAALAGAGNLPDVNDAVVAARDWSGENGYVHGQGTVSVQVTTPYGGDADKVEVVIQGKMPTTFLGVLGIVDANVTARAVAERTAGGGGSYAIFANNSGCPGNDTLEVSGSTNAIEGAVHSNGTLKVNGSDNTFDGAATSACGLDESGSNNSFDPPYQSTGTQPMPLNYTYSDFPCDMEFFSDTDLTSVPAAWLNGDKDTGVLIDRVYCSTAKLTLSGSDITGNVTLAAQGEVNVAGSNFNLTGYWNDILLFTESNSSSALDVSGSGGQWQGILFAPNGLAKVQGSSNLSIAGSIIADQVQMSGSDWSLAALEESGGGAPSLSLIE